MIEQDSGWISADEVADAMYELAVNEEFGNGTIYEVLQGKTRVVPEFHTEPPSGPSAQALGLDQAEAQMFEHLKSAGMKV